MQNIENVPAGFERYIKATLESGQSFILAGRFNALVVCPTEIDGLFQVFLTSHNCKEALLSTNADMIEKSDEKMTIHPIHFGNNVAGEKRIVVEMDIENVFFSYGFDEIISYIMSRVQSV